MGLVVDGVVVSKIKIGLICIGGQFDNFEVGYLFDCMGCSFVCLYLVVLMVYDNFGDWCIDVQYIVLDMCMY